MQNNLTPNEIAEMIRTQWLGGKGRVTQMPGKADPSTRKFYSNHKGIDIGVNAGTPIVAPSDLEILGKINDNTGYGQRLATYDPRTDTTYLLSHLSKYGDSNGRVAPGTVLAYSGGTPGTVGAGNTTGAHVDIETYKGRYMPTAGVARATSTPNYDMGGYAKKMMELARSKYGNKTIGVASSADQLQKYLKTGRKIVKLG